MQKSPSQKRAGRLPPAAAAAIFAAAASAATTCAGAALWSLLPQEGAAPALLVAPLVLMPLAAAAATWLYASRAIGASLEPAVESLERLAAHDFATPTALAFSAETAALALSLERCRVALAERQRAAKAHAAVARLMAAAIGRLAEGDLSARIDVELPQPYRSFGDDFNAAMEALQSPSGQTGALLRERARDIADAAGQLGRRAARLMERVEDDLIAIEAEDGVEDALRIARHTLVGAGVAARRNIEAAEGFAALGRLMEADADRLDGHAPQEKAGRERSEAPPHMPAATFPDIMRAPALKLASG